MAERQSRTLFVRNLPFTATNEQLTEAFGEVGPVKTAFVVKEKGSDKCKGYGYVKFSMLEDAVKAREEVKQLDGRKIFSSFANAKREVKKKHKGTKDNPTEPADDSTTSTKSVKTAKTQEKMQKSFVAVTDGIRDDKTTDSYSQAKTVALCGLTPGMTPEKLKVLIKDVKCVAQVVFPVKGQVHNAHLRFKSVRDAKRAVRRLQVMKLQAAQLSNSKAAHSHQDKRGRLIIRNLSFKCTEEDLQRHFGKFGQVTEIKIPTKPDGQKCGFGFVQFSSLGAASRAVQEMNSKKILGRPVAVDWAVAKTKYLASAAAAPDAAAKDLSSSEDGGTHSEDSSDGDTGPSQQCGVKRKAEEESDQDSDDAEADGDGDDDSEDSDVDSKENDDNNDKSETGSEEARSGDSSDDDDDDDDDSDNEKARKTKNINKKGSKPEGISDVGEGRTIFVRNVPFEADEDELAEVFQEFGDLVYARLVVNAQTEVPKGTAFVQFRSKETADKCIEKGQEQGRNAGITLNGRRLLVAPALSRTEAQNRKQTEKTKEKKDSRNLFLAREGMIRPGTQAAAGISQEDMAKRMRIEQMKRERLKNQNIFVSSTRLCMHNLPTKVNDRELRQIVLKAVENPAATITECRVMRDLKRVSASGAAKSLGYAFVNFTQHEHALKALHALNNSEVFGPKKRPIAEFSLENRRALEAKEKRKEKNKVKNEGKQLSSLSAQKQQDRIAQAQHKGPKGLPKHFGPKIRHRDRNKSRAEGRQPQRDAVQDGKKKKNKDLKKQPKVKQMKPSKKKARMTDGFDNLVNKYKEKISKGSVKWFES